MPPILLFVGDSDIAKWPNDLLPRFHQPSSSTAAASSIVSGHNGATLSEIVPHLETTLQQLYCCTAKAVTLDDDDDDEIVLVACAGENDIGNGMTLDETLEAFQRLICVFFNNSTTTHHRRTRRALIFLGPKLEPWLNNDAASRKQYVKLSRALDRACTKHERCHDIHFVDCLTMFCGTSSTVPGATLGGKAKADLVYFCEDFLHLNRQGYRIWKRVVEDHLCELFP